MDQANSRRTFLRYAPLAAVAAALPLHGAPIVVAAASQTASAPQPFQLFSAASLADAMKALQAKPGNDSLYASPALPFTVVLTTEEKKSAKEFEWHEGRDHVLLMLEGSTKYELGGKPQGSHNTKPAEWLAPASIGATTYTLHKGDLLVIPRGTLHKRSTEASATFFLISTTGEVPGEVSSGGKP